MPTNCDELFDFATKLESSCTIATEQIPRTSAHKAYYFAYHFLKQAFPNVDKHPSLKDAGGAHIKFVLGLKIESGNYPAKKNQLKEIASQLDSLKKHRTKADYRLGNSFPPQEAQEAIRKANRIIAKYNDHFAEQDIQECKT